METLLKKEADLTQSQWIWKNGEFIPWKEATTHLLSHSLHYGNAVFEGVRAYPTDKGLAIFRLQEHTQRLLDSAKIVALDCSFGFDELCKAQIELVRKNTFRGDKSVYIRPLIYLGYGDLRVAHYHSPIEVMMACWEWDGYLGEDAQSRGIRVKTSSFRRPSNQSGFLKAKVSGNYLNSQLARYEAYKCGFDECILLDDSGFVTEASSECLFVVKKDEFITPPWENTLCSITQESVMQIIQKEGYKLTQRAITRDEIYTADECFLVGTAAEITPVVELDFRKIGDDFPKTRWIQERFSQVAGGEDPDFLHFLTYIQGETDAN